MKMHQAVTSNRGKIEWVKNIIGIFSFNIIVVCLNEVLSNFRTCISPLQLSTDIDPKSGSVKSKPAGHLVHSPLPNREYVPTVKVKIQLIIILPINTLFICDLIKQFEEWGYISLSESCQCCKIIHYYLLVCMHYCHWQLMSPTEIWLLTAPYHSR